MLIYLYMLTLLILPFCSPFRFLSYVKYIYVFSISQRWSGSAQIAGVVNDWGSDGVVDYIVLIVGLIISHYCCFSATVILTYVKVLV